MKTKSIYPIFKGVTNQDGEDPVYRFVASTQTVDRHGERILVSAWDLTNYKKNPIILFGHDAWSLDNAIGKAIAVEITDKELIIDVVFSKANERAQKIKAMVEEGVLNMVSVGFIPKKWEDIDGIPTVTEAELLEVSIVQIPANPEAESIRRLGFKMLDNGEVAFEEETKEEAPKVEEKKEEEEEEEEETPAPETPKEDAPKEEGENGKETPEETPKDPQEDEEEEEVETDDEEGEEDDEEIEVEIEDDEDEEEVEVDIEIEGEEEGDEKNLSSEKELAIMSEVKEGRTLSTATLEKIATARGIAEEVVSNVNSFISALDALTAETGDKGLEGYVLIKTDDLKNLREIMRNQDRSSEKALSFIKNLI